MHRRRPGGVVVGPRLKEMAHLAHTEYELRGRSSLDVREVLRETMFAATVTGSPVQNACRVIERHESGGRGYYAGALALIGTDPGGSGKGRPAPSPSTPHPHPHRRHRRAGRLRVPVGATLVRGSDPAGEVAETHAKAAGVLAALGVRPARPSAEAARPRLADDPGCGPRWTGAVPAWPRSGCGCRSAPRPSTGTPWSSTGRTPSPRCSRTCCGRAGWTSPSGGSTSRGCGRRCSATPVRWCWAPAPAILRTRPTRRCGSCAPWRPR